MRMTHNLVDNAVLIAGPTASGKSALALRVACETGGTVINTDALQVYEDLRVLSARPDAADIAAAPHALYGFVSGAVRYSVGRYIHDVEKLIDNGAITAPLIFTGGTGLYFRALTEGLSPIPDVEAPVLEAAAQRRAALGPVGFYGEVVARDPAMARLEPGDAQRTIRAWAVFEATGIPLSVFQQQKGEVILASPKARVVLCPPREELYARCEARFDAMLEQGALTEVAALQTKGYDLQLPVMKALGVAELADYLAGGSSLEDAVLLVKQNTRRFAKRQLTWFRNQMTDWPVADKQGADNQEDAYRLIMEQLRQ